MAPPEVGSGNRFVASGCLWEGAWGCKRKNAMERTFRRGERGKPSQAGGTRRRGIFPAGGLWSLRAINLSGLVTIAASNRVASRGCGVSGQADPAWPTRIAPPARRRSPTPVRRPLQRERSRSFPDEEPPAFRSTLHQVRRPRNPTHPAPKERSIPAPRCRQVLCLAGGLFKTGRHRSLVIRRSLIARHEHTIPKRPSGSFRPDEDRGETETSQGFRQTDAAGDPVHRYRQPRHKGN